MRDQLRHGAGWIVFRPWQIGVRVALSRWYPWGRPRDLLSSPPIGQPTFEGRPRLETLHPSWTVIGERFNVQSDGRAYLAVRGTGFGRHAILVVAGEHLDTCYASDRELSACIPDDLLCRAASLPVWVDNREGARPLSGIRCFRVLSRRATAARVPARGAWRRTKNAVKLLWQLRDAVRWTAQLPLLYALRAWRTRWCRLLGFGPRRSVNLPPGIAAISSPSASPGSRTYSASRSSTGISAISVPSNC